MWWRVVFMCMMGWAFVSCESKEKQVPAFYESEDDTEDVFDTDSVVDEDSTEVNYSRDSDEVSVPFVENGGVKLIKVTINGQFTVDMILDSGCSTTLISIAEARYLYEKGCFSQEDFLGIEPSQIADGSIMVNMIVNLKQIVIGGKIACYNVRATVVDNAQAPLLLGNDVLNRAPSYTVDNVNNVVNFNLK